MNVYKISQNTNSGYDTFDCAIVIALNEEHAKQIHPSSDVINDMSDWYARTTWTEPKNVDVEFICEYNGQYLGGKVLCASFNAG